MIQLHLPKVELDNINMQLLQAEPKGTLAIVLDLDGKLRAIDQGGNEVAILPEAPTPDVTPEMEKAIIDNVSEKLNKGLNAALEAQEKEISEAFTKQFKELQGEINKLKKAAK